MRKQTYNDVKQIFENYGHKLISTIYIDPKTKLEYICGSCGQTKITTLRHFKDPRLTDGYKCKNCISNKIGIEMRIPFEIINKAFLDRNYTLLTVEYINMHQKLQYKCDNGHISTITYKKLKTGQGCKICGDTFRRLDYNVVKAQFEAKGYELISKTYTTSKGKLQCKCLKCEHIFTTTQTRLQCGCGCPQCAQKYKSELFSSKEFQEKATKIRESKYDKNTLRSVASQQSQKFCWEIYNKLSKEFKDSCFFHELNKEIGITYLGKFYQYDFACRATKTLIEFNGIKFHALPSLSPNNKTWHVFNKNKTAQECWDYEKIKYEGMESKGYTILTVWDFEYKQNPTATIQKCLDFINSRPIIINPSPQPTSTP